MKKSPEQRADCSGVSKVPPRGGTVIAFMTLWELQVLGPLWVREMLRRRPRHTAGSKEAREDSGPSPLVSATSSKNSVQ